MPQNRFWHLLAKKIAGEATTAEIRELEELMRLHPDWQYAAQHIQDIWGLSTKEDPLAAEDPFLRHLSKMKKIGLVPANMDEADCDLIASDPGSFNLNRNKKRFIAYALLGLVGLTLVLFIKPFQRKAAPIVENTSEVSTRPGSKSKLVLPDGSSVWLNAGSKLTYNKNFGSTRRNVTLTGEAYFEVVRLPSLPFIIETSTMKIRVVGTSFNVKSYPNERTSETSVIRGSVEVIAIQRPSEKFILKPNEKLVVSNEVTIQPRQKTPLIALSSLTYAKKDSILIETAWVENRLAFDDEPFGDLAVKMERWYGVKIVFGNEEIKKEHLSGSFVNETIQQALDALKITVPFHYQMSQNTITITND
jgi:transmembrane sensor